MRESKYWDDFNERSKETASCIKQGLPIPVRRIAVFVTDRCNFRCKYSAATIQPRRKGQRKYLRDWER